MEIAGRFMISIFICGAFFLGGVHVGRIEGADRLLNKQVVSAQALADNIVNVQECRMEVKEIRDSLNDFKFGVCKGLGLIKGG